MKNNKIIKCMFLSFIAFSMVGCQPSNQHNIGEVEQILAMYDDVSAIDISYTVNIVSTDINITANSRMVMESTEDNLIAFIEVEAAQETQRLYLVNNYLCTEINSEYSVSEVPDFDVEAENPMPTNLDFNQLEYELNVTETNTLINYTIEISDANLETMVEEITGQEIIGMDIELQLGLFVNKMSGDLDFMEMNFTLSQGDQSVSVNIVITIDAIGDDVVYEVPSEVTQEIQNYIDVNTIEPEPEPEPVIYEDTADGVINYHHLGTFQDVAYDNDTNQVVVLKSNSIDIYDADTMELRRSITTLLDPVCIDVDDGRLAAGYKTNSFRIYDLSNFQYTIYQTNTDVSEIALDDDVVIHVDDDQFVSIYHRNVVTNDEFSMGHYYQPQFIVNHEDHILYVTEPSSTSTLLAYLHTQSGEKLIDIYTHDYPSQSFETIFDGKFVYHFGSTYNRFNGSTYSMNSLGLDYSAYPGFTPAMSLYQTNGISFVRGATYQNRIGIYDNYDEEFVYQFSIDGGSIIELGAGKFLAVCDSREYIAIVDTTQIDDNLVYEVIEEETVGSISENDNLKSLRSSPYIKSVVDENYIYTLNDNRYELNVYDIETLEKIHTEQFSDKPVCFDADSGKVVIGFGDDNYFRIYNTSTWDYETVEAGHPVYTTVINGDTIIHAQIDQWCDVYIYNILTHTKQKFATYYQVSIAINREEGIIYFGERNLTRCYLKYYNINALRYIYSSEHANVKSEIRLDGNFIHYGGATFDKSTGLRISNSDLAREYQQSEIYHDKATIFDDGLYSIYTAIDSNEELVTIIYDLTADSPIFTYSGGATNASRVGDKIIIMNNLNDTIRTYDLALD